MITTRKKSFLERTATNRKTLLHFRLIILAMMVIAMSGCSGIVSPHEFKARSDFSIAVPAKMAAKDLADCLVPYLEETRFFITGDRLIALVRKYKDSWQVYATNGDYTMYVVDIDGTSKETSTATLYSYNRAYHLEELRKNFLRGMKSCGRMRDLKKIHPFPPAQLCNPSSWTRPEPSPYPGTAGSCLPDDNRPL